MKTSAAQLTCSVRIVPAPCAWCALNQHCTSTLQKEADAKGYGRLYAEFGGGKDGLEACAAGMSHTIRLPILMPSSVPRRDQALVKHLV